MLFFVSSLACSILSSLDLGTFKSLSHDFSTSALFWAFFGLLGSENYFLYVLELRRIRKSISSHFAESEGNTVFHLLKWMLDNS